MRTRGKEGNVDCALFTSSLKLGFSGGAVVKNLPTNAGDAGLISGLWRSLGGGGNSNPLQYSCLGNPMGSRTWRAEVHGVAKSWTQLSNRACTHSLKLSFCSMSSTSLSLCVTMEMTLITGFLEAEACCTRKPSRYPITYPYCLRSRWKIWGVTFAFPILSTWVQYL